MSHFSNIFISDLNPANPSEDVDPNSQGDGEVRLIKNALLNSFPGVSGAVDLGLPVMLTTNASGNLDNFDIQNSNIVRFNNMAATDIRGLSGGSRGRRIILANSSGSTNLIISSNADSSLNANRILEPTGISTSIGPRCAVELFYDDVVERWRMISLVGVTP